MRFKLHFDMTDGCVQLPTHAKYVSSHSSVQLHGLVHKTSAQVVNGYSINECFIFNLPFCYTSDDTPIN